MTTKEHFEHDRCPSCKSASVPAERVPDQSLRGCEKCGHVWTEDLIKPESRSEPAWQAVLTYGDEHASEFDPERVAKTAKAPTLWDNQAFDLMRAAVEREAAKQGKGRTLL